MLAGHPRVGQAAEQPLAVVEALDLEALDGQARQVAVVAQRQHVAAATADTAVVDRLLAAADAGCGISRPDAVLEQRGADLQAVAGDQQVRQVDHAAATDRMDALGVQVAAAATDGRTVLHFVLLVDHRRSPGLGVVGEERQVRRRGPEHRQPRRPAGVGLGAIVMAEFGIVVDRRQVGPAVVAHAVEAHRWGDGQAAVGDRVLDVEALRVLLAGRHECRLQPAVVVARGLVDLARHVHEDVALVLVQRRAQGQLRAVALRYRNGWCCAVPGPCPGTRYASACHRWRAGRRRCPRDGRVARCGRRNSSVAGRSRGCPADGSCTCRSTWCRWYRGGPAGGSGPARSRSGRWSTGSAGSGSCWRRTASSASFSSAGR